MIIARLKWNTRLFEVDEFIQKFIKKEKRKHFDIELKIMDTELLVFFFKRSN